MKKSDEEIKAEIIEGASKLFIKYGYNKTTMEDIAKAVRKGKSTLYYYYKSKDDIVIAMLEHEGYKIFSYVSGYLKKTSSAVEKMQYYFSATKDEVKRIASIFYILKEELKGNNEILSRIKLIFNDRSVILLEEILNYGIYTKEFLKLKKEKVSETARLIDNITNLLITNKIIDEQSDDWQENVILFSELILSGIK